MNVIDAVKSRRSIRAYRKGPVPQAALDDMLEAARLAPSWKNNQSFSYILVQDRQLIGQLGEITGYNPSQSAYENAEYFLVLCGDPTLSGRRLVAEENGVGMCWVGAFYENPVKKLLNIPEDIRVVALSPVGIPDEEPEAKPRRTLQEMVFLNKYGNLL